MLTMDKATEFRKRLLAAFAALRKQKIVARANYLCCGSCAAAGIGEYVKKIGAKGGVYWHDQDDENVPEGFVYVGFGARDDGDDAEIGRALVDALKAQGLKVEWDGTAMHRVMAEAV